MRALRNPSILLLFVIAASAQDEGVSAPEIVIGQCAPFAGSAQALGQGMNQGLRAAFEEANRRGGVQGRRIRFLAEDDSYEPEKCLDCTLRMIRERHVFALAGYVGTPTAQVAVPIATELKVPLVGPFAGALLLRSPVQRYVFNIRASYNDETEALVAYLTRTAPAPKIAVFYQNDTFGLSGLNGVVGALARRGLTLAGKGSFERNTVAVMSGLARVMAAAPDAVIIVAPYQPAAKFIREARQAGLAAQFAALSFTGIESLIEEIGETASGIIVSQVVCSPSDTRNALARDYQAALRAVLPFGDLSYVNFEGYVAGRVLLAALDRAGRNPNAEALVDAFDAMSKLDLGGMTFSFSASNHQGGNVVFLTTVKDGHVQSLL